MSRPRFVLWFFGLGVIGAVSREVWTSNLSLFSAACCQILIAAETLDPWLRLVDPGPSLRRARKVK